jgi:hypothetical protein
LRTIGFRATANLLFPELATTFSGFLKYAVVWYPIPVLKHSSSHILPMKLGMTFTRKAAIEEVVTALRLVLPLILFFK